MIKKLHFWHYASVILLALLLVSVFTSGFGYTNASPDEAAQRLVDFMNKYKDNVLQGQTAKVTSVEPVDGLIKVNLNIGGTNVVGYVSNTGMLYFPQAYDLKKTAEAFDKQTGGATTTAVYTKSDKPKFELYYMSYCPYGQQAVQGFAPVAELLKDKIEFVPRFVIYEDWCGWDVSCKDKPAEIPNYCFDKEAKLCSMHGINEANENIRQLCVFNEQKERYWDYTLCVMSDCSLDKVNECWKTCADKTGVDKAKVEKCFKDEGASLLKAEREANVKNKVNGSPTVFLNGDSYSGGRTPENFKTGVCSAFNTAPSECSQTLNSASSAVSGNCG